MAKKSLAKQMKENAEKNVVRISLTAAWIGFLVVAIGVLALLEQVVFRDDEEMRKKVWVGIYVWILAVAMSGFAFVIPKINVSGPE